jgi:hypothetical protein
MAVVLYTRVPELDLEAYDRVMVGLELDASPAAGAILHIASEGVGSVNVCEVWQTREAAESFIERQLKGALQAQGIQEPLSYRIEPLHNLFAPDMDMIDRIGAVSLPATVTRIARAS